MRTITHESKTSGDNGVSAEVVGQICRVLDGGGLVCVPCGASYRILADLENPDAVTRLLQAKRRTKKTPGLVFVADERMLGALVKEVPASVKSLASHFWPGPLTILLAPNGGLPRKVTKQIATREGRFGVRVPQDGLAREVVQRLGRPVLVSSANRQKKQGAGSPAQVRKNFVHAIDLFIDAGDLPQRSPSTVVSVEEEEPAVVRPGAIPEEQVRQAV